MFLADNSISQGNDVKPRPQVMIEDGQKTWLDPQKLSPGILTKFYVYIGYVNTSSSSAQIRLQIWRPSNNDENPKYLIVWEFRVTVALTNSYGALHVVIHILL